MLRGSLVHCAQLEPDALAPRYAFVPDDAPRKPTEAQWNAKKSNESSQAAKDWWNAFGDEVAGRTVIAAEDFALMRLQLDAIKANPTLAELFGRGEGEVSLFWVDELTGVYCKARLDWLHPVNAKTVRIGELKSAADESPNGFGRACARMGYHRQDAHYTAGFEAITGMHVEEFVFAAVTSVQPVLAVPYVLTDEIREQARDERQELLELYARCQESGQWPSYGDGLVLLDFPAYARRSNEVEFNDVD